MAQVKDNNNNKSLMLKIYVATTTETMLFSNLPKKDAPSAKTIKNVTLVEIRICYRKAFNFKYNKYM